MQAEDILHFWFEELSPAQHFAQEDAIDAMIRVRFGAAWQAAQRCELWAWRASPEGRLAEILVLDQFSLTPCVCAGRAGLGTGTRAGGRAT